MSYKFGILILAAVHVCTSSSLPPCVCTRNFKPVCGSDGVTYSNECLLECERSKTNSDLSVAKEGPCENDLRVPNTCICTLEYKPVCGTDGKTYPNRCSLTCERSSNPSIEVKHEGQCVEDEIKVADVPLCECTREKNLVCGSDGKTYSNPCLLNCAAQNNPGLKVEHAGPCDNSVKVVEQPYPKTSPTCACPLNLKPVCGSDGVTYDNECLLRCAGEHLTVVKEAPCDN